MPAWDNLRFGLSPIDSDIFAGGNPRRPIKDERTERPWMDTARYHMGLRGRNKFKNRTKLRALMVDGSNSDPIPIEDHPSALIIPVMPPPTIYSGMHETEDIPAARGMSITPMGADLLERAKKLGKDVNLTRGISALAFYRLIAKIAHSFAVAELGQTFAPYLINLIEGEIPMFASHFIGSGLGDNPPPSDQLHELEFAPSLVGPKNDELLQVRVRLFANLGCPNHYAVVGSRWRTR